MLVEELIFEGPFVHVNGPRVINTLIGVGSTIGFGPLLAIKADAKAFRNRRRSPLFWSWSPFKRPFLVIMLGLDPRFPGPANCQSFPSMTSGLLGNLSLNPWQAGRVDHIQFFPQIQTNQPWGRFQFLQGPIQVSDVPMDPTPAGSQPPPRSRANLPRPRPSRGRPTSRLRPASCVPG